MIEPVFRETGGFSEKNTFFRRQTGRFKDFCLHLRIEIATHEFNNRNNDKI